MKKLISYIIVAALLLALMVPGVFAADRCTHSYLSQHFDATCLSKAYTVYTCSLCNDSYIVYDDEFSPPGGYWALLEGNRSGSTLTITLSVGNNPGAWSNIFILPYNKDALAVSEMTVGTVWNTDDSEVSITDITENGGGKHINFCAQNSAIANNYSNGLLCTVKFDIIDETQPYKIGITYTARDIINISFQALPITTVNLVGKGELGGHNYTVSVTPPSCTLDGFTTHTCTVCGDSYRSDTVPATGHNREQSAVLTPPGRGTEGLAEMTCTVCAEKTTVSIPALPSRMLGDVYHDDIINAKDANLLDQMINGDIFPEDDDQMYAADIFQDGALNGKDNNTLTQVINGDISFN